MLELMIWGMAIGVVVAVGSLLLYRFHAMVWIHAQAMQRVILLLCRLCGVEKDSMGLRF